MTEEEVSSGVWWGAGDGKNKKGEGQKVSVPVASFSYQVKVAVVRTIKPLLWDRSGKSE